jgi:[methyl-Co(III) methanol-specific corrinoid protein]:coenzyme M methyltransferase
MFHFDSKSDPEQAKAIVGNRIGLVGNIDNVQTMYARGPEVVRDEVRACLDAGIDRHDRTRVLHTPGDEA